IFYSITVGTVTRCVGQGPTHAVYSPCRPKKASQERGLRPLALELRIETHGKGDQLPNLSSLTRLRRRSTSENDFERSGAIRARSKTERQNGRDNRGAVQVPERPLFSGKICLRNRICAVRARNSRRICYYAHTRPCRCNNANSPRRLA